MIPPRTAPVSIQLVKASGDSVAVGVCAGGAGGGTKFGGGGIGCGDLASVEGVDTVGLGVGTVMGAETAKLPVSPLISTV